MVVEVRDCVPCTVVGKKTGGGGAGGVIRTRKVRIHRGEKVGGLIPR